MLKPGGQDAGGDAGETSAPSCAIDPPGTFTFHVHNAGSATLAWNLGCMHSLPIVLHLPEGDLPTGPGAVDGCEFTCDLIYAGTATPGGCSDCGPGYSGSAAAGGSGDIIWDRRVYTRLAFEPACRASSSPVISPQATCALGHAVAPSATQSGTISVCPGTVYLGSCHDPATSQTIQPRTIDFTVDTTGTEATIEVQ